jgi:BirA family biotin operon repressor/biotin-[acetyl-CoA-carboxylase] ligase
MTLPHIHCESIDSTNAEALRRAAAGLTGACWITADRQTGGKGRSGRAWASEPGNFYGSLLWPLTCPPALAPQLTLVAGVAVHDAITAVTGTQLRGLQLKWPNDILVGAAKLGGILIETTNDPRRSGLLAVIGIGINLTRAPSDLGRAVTALAAAEVAVTPAQLRVALSNSIVHYHGLWSDGAGFGRIRDAWHARGTPIGTAITVNSGDGPIAGTFAGLGADGSLRLRQSDVTERAVTFGDVTIVQPRFDRS